MAAHGRNLLDRTWQTNLHNVERRPDEREITGARVGHTLPRLPTHMFYPQGVKANVLFPDRKPAQEKAWTEKLWIYDLRTNKHVTLKKNQLKRSDLDEFVTCYHAENRHERTESERFKCFAYDDLIKRDKVNLDIFGLKDESLEDSANLPPPDVIGRRNHGGPGGRARTVQRNRYRFNCRDSARKASDNGTRELKTIKIIRVN